MIAASEEKLLTLNVPGITTGNVNKLYYFLQCLMRFEPFGVLWLVFF